MDRGYLDMELLRFSTAGSVDDGKSTLKEDCFMIASRFSKTSWRRWKRQVKAVVMKR